MATTTLNLGGAEEAALVRGQTGKHRIHVGQGVPAFRVEGSLSRRPQGQRSVQDRGLSRRQVEESFGLRGGPLRGRSKASPPCLDHGISPQAQRGKA